MYLLRSLIYCLLFLIVACEHNQPLLLSSFPIGLTSKDAPFYANQFITGETFLQVEKKKIERKGAQSYLDFVVRWDASWRSNEQYDAAWVFLKRLNQNATWEPVKIDKNRIQYLGNAPLNTAKPEWKVSPDAFGIMIYRAENGEGDNYWTFRLALDNAEMLQLSAIEIYGLEMVHIAEGAFELGTLKNERDRREVLTPGAGGAPYNPFFTYQDKGVKKYGGIYKVTSERPIDIGPKDGNLFWIDANIPGTNTFSGIPEGRLDQSFPKGYQGFYQMKYELSQGEYCAFLNSLSSKQQSARDLTTTIEFKRSILDYRNTIYKDQKGCFKAERPNRPCNFISWLDGQAFADWAGLRHMTELEFEKSCRGPQKAIYRAYVWGVNEIEERSNMRFCENIYDTNGNLALNERGHISIDGNIHASMFSYFNMLDVCSPEGRFYDPKCVGCRTFSGGDGGRGPVQKGIFGRSSGGDRIKAGASYFGAMELGGNLQEPVVTVGHPSGRRFRGTHGDGILSEEGNATNEDWQPTKDGYAFGGRGGCWQFHENHARTADRFKGLRTKQNRRASHIGFRGVRSAF